MNAGINVTDGKRVRFGGLPAALSLWEHSCDSGSTYYLFDGRNNVPLSRKGKFTCQIREARTKLLGFAAAQQHTGEKIS